MIVLQVLSGYLQVHKKFNPPEIKLKQNLLLSCDTFMKYFQFSTFLQVSEL